MEVKFKFNIPQEMAHLKIDPRGYPIPFFVPIKNGEPQFLYMDKKKQDLCIDKHLCHVCGKKLVKDSFYFVSGPMGYQNQVSSDAAMHLKCAEFALAVCPHMLYQKAERKDNRITPVHAPDKPEYLLLIKATKYKAKLCKEVGYRLIHYRSVSATKYIYVDNKLVKE